MAWRVTFSATAKKELAALDRESQQRIWDYLRQRIATSTDPRDYADPLRRNLVGLWKFRIGNYRLIAEIKDGELLVLVLRVGHRSKVYGGH